MTKIMLIFGLMFSSAHAAQTATVIVDSASVYDKPQPDGVVVGTVTKDTSIAVSNAPTNGFYKSRIPGGAIGWVSGNDILTGSPPAGAVKPEETTESTPRTKKKKKDSASVSDHSRIMISGGIQLLNYSGLPDGITAVSSKLGFGGTFEMQFKLSELFYWAGRAEYFTSTNTQAVSSTLDQTVSFTTVPLMVGLVVVPVSKSDFRLGFGIYGGISLLTSMTLSQVTSAATDTVTYSSSDLCFYGNLQSSFGLTSSMSLLGDVGYRIHTSTYPAYSDDAISLDAFKGNFGGLVARLGVEFRM
jgi:hypothetical protein